MKLQRARAIVLRVHTIQHQRVNMDVQIERRPKPLNDGHRAATPVHDAWRSRACLLRKPHEHPDHRAAQGVIPRHHVPNLVRQAQHPLADRPPRETHDPPGARRALPSSAPHSSDTPPGPCTRTEPGDPAHSHRSSQRNRAKPPASHPHRTKPSNSSWMNRGRRSPSPHLGGLVEERPEMIEHDLIQNALRRRPRLVARGRSRHDAHRCQANATARFGRIPRDSASDACSCVNPCTAAWIAEAAMPNARMARTPFARAGRRGICCARHHARP